MLLGTVKEMLGELLEAGIIMHGTLPEEITLSFNDEHAPSESTLEELGVEPGSMLTARIDGTCREARRRAAILHALRLDGFALANLDDSFKADQEVVLAAVKRNGFALKHAAPSLREDRGFILKAVATNGYALKAAPAQLRNDRVVVLAAVQQCGDALQYASQGLQNDPKVAAAARPR